MTTSFTTADHKLGSTIITYAVRSFMVLMTIAATWSCSTLLGGLCMLTAMTLLSYVLSQLAYLAINLFVTDASVAKLGHAAGALSVRITSLFSRKAAPAQPVSQPDYAAGYARFEADRAAGKVADAAAAAAAAA